MTTITIDLKRVRPELIAPGYYNDKQCALFDLSAWTASQSGVDPRCRARAGQLYNCLSRYEFKDGRWIPGYCESLAVKRGQKLVATFNMDIDDAKFLAYCIRVYAGLWAEDCVVAA